MAKKTWKTPELIVVSRTGVSDDPGAEYVLKACKDAVAGQLYAQPSDTTGDAVVAATGGNLANNKNVTCKQPADASYAGAVNYPYVCTDCHQAYAS